MLLLSVPAFPAMEHAALERSYRHQRHEHEHGGEDPDANAPESDDHPYRRDHPDRRGRGQAPDIGARPKDGARAEKSDAGDYLCGDAGGIRAGAKEWLEPDRREQARADADERHRANAGRVTVEFPLGTDCDREDEGDDDAEGEIQIAAKRQRR
jgi:hypothetical protein